MCVAAAIAGGAIAGGLIQGNAATSAANTQANAANRAADINLQEFNTITGQEQPFMQGGYGALNQLNYLLGIGAPLGAQAASLGAGGGQLGMAVPGMNGGIRQVANAVNGGLGGGAGMVAAPGRTGLTVGAPAPGSPAGGFGSLLSPFTADTFKQYSPAYQFEKQQLQQGVLNGDASSMGALSGAAQSDLAKQTGQFANEAFNNAFNQYQAQQGNIYQRLAGIAQLGQNAAANTGAQGTQLAGNIGSAVANAGAARAAGQVGVANAISGGINSALPWLLSGGGGDAALAGAAGGGGTWGALG